MPFFSGLKLNLTNKPNLQFDNFKLVKNSITLCFIVLILCGLCGKKYSTLNWHNLFELWLKQEMKLLM